MDTSRASQPEISVIVPVFNVEKYLARCLKSVMEQTFSDIEILVINDGSTDSSPAIARKLASEDARIKVFDKKNGGLSSARNSGLREASGKYVFFLDSDDWIDRDCLRLMRDSMTDDVDCAVCAFTAHAETSSYEEAAQSNQTWNDSFQKKSGVYPVVPNIKREMCSVAWNKLYRRKILSTYDIRFCEGLVNEDEAFLWDYMIHCRNYAFVPRQLYHYWRRDASIMASRDGTRKNLDIFKIFNHVYTNIRKWKNINEYKDILASDYCGTFRHVYSVMGEKYRQAALNCLSDYTFKLNPSRNLVELLIEFTGKHQGISAVDACLRVFDARHAEMSGDGEKIFAAVFASAITRALTEASDDRAKLDILRRLNSRSLRGLLERHRDEGDEKIRTVSTAVGCVFRESLAANPPKARLVVSGSAAASPKVSVIIPCFNTARWLDETLASVCGQTLKDLEIICIDDGSSDSTLTQLKARAGRDRRISVYTEPNSGQACARNAGLAEAHGQYVCFVDSDDTLDAEALETLCAKADAANLDMLLFDLQPFSDDSTDAHLETMLNQYKGSYGTSREYGGIHTGPEMFALPYRNGDYQSSPCHYLVRTVFLNSIGLRFLPGIVHEDEPFTFRCLLSSRRVSHVRKAFYHRRLRAGSIMTSPRTFASVSGYWRGLADMLQAAAGAATGPYDENAACAREFCARRLADIRSLFRGLSEQERRMAVTLGSDLPLFRESVSGVVGRDEAMAELKQSFAAEKQKADDEHSRALADRNAEIEALRRALDGKNGEASALQAALDGKTGEAEALKHSLSFRIGRAATWFPRKVRGGVRCFREHGLAYTCRRLVCKIFRIH